MKKYITALTAIVLTVCMLTVAVSAEVLVPSSPWYMDRLSHYFFHSAFYSDDAVTIYGYNEATELRSKPEYEYVTFDGVIYFAFGVDELSEGDRYVSIAYTNPNLGFDVAEEDEPCIKFTYDVQTKSFRLLAGGKMYSETDRDLTEPVFADWIDDTGLRFYSFGISVTEGSVRYFVDSMMIFEYEDPAIGKDTKAPLLFLNDNNYMMIRKIKIATAGYYYSLTKGDSNGDGKINLSDVATILKHITEWKLEYFNEYGADVNNDGKINMHDAARIMQSVARWEDLE